MWHPLIIIINLIQLYYIERNTEQIAGKKKGGVGGEKDK